VEGSSPRDAVGRFAAEGLVPHAWSNGPGDRYGWHAHGYHKVLICTEGSITFHLRDRDVTMRAGDRLDLEPGVEHAATVGPEGVRCLEASR
jgi:quercetin dioxygenase-like cupin family protein